MLPWRKFTVARSGSGRPGLYVPGISTQSGTNGVRRSKRVPTVAVTTGRVTATSVVPATKVPCSTLRSEEHTSELQSLAYLVCRLLLEKKKNTKQEIKLLLGRAKQESGHAHPRQYTTTR